MKTGSTIPTVVDGQACAARNADYNISFAGFNLGFFTKIPGFNRRLAFLHLEPEIAANGDIMQVDRFFVGRDIDPADCRRYIDRSFVALDMDIAIQRCEL